MIRKKQMISWPRFNMFIFGKTSQTPAEEVFMGMSLGSKGFKTGGVWMPRVLQDISTIWFAKTCGQNNGRMVVSNIFLIFTPIWGKIPILTYFDTFQMGWNHQLDSKPSSLMQSHQPWCRRVMDCLWNGPFAAMPRRQSSWGTSKLVVWLVCWKWFVGNISKNLLGWM